MNKKIISYRFFCGAVLLFCIFITSNSFAALTVESASPAEGQVGKTLEITLKGTGFDESTRVMMYPENAAVSIDTPGSATKVKIKDNLAFVTDWEGGLQIIDIKNPINPKIISSLEIPDVARDIALADNTAYITTQTGVLQIIDISDPQNPTIISTANTKGVSVEADIFATSRGITINDNTAYITYYSSNQISFEWTYGLEIFDVNNPANPKLMGTIEIKDGAVGICVINHTAYIAGDEGGLQVIDVSDPANPKIIGILDTPGYALDIKVIGQTAYVADSKEGLQIIDVSSPENPVLISTIDTSGYAKGIEIAGQTAYVADKSGGLQIIDITDSNHPVMIGTVNTRDSAVSVGVNNDMVYITDSKNGLAVVPVPFKIRPSSINNETSLSITLPDPVIPGKYNLRVFNENESAELTGALIFEPVWTPKTGKFSMEVQGQIAIEDLEIKEDGSLIAAFGPGSVTDCRGISDIIKSGEKWTYKLNIISDINNEKISFKIWDKSLGRIYNIEDTISFKADTTINHNIQKASEIVIENFNTGPGGFTEAEGFSVDNGRYYFQGQGSELDWWSTWEGGDNPAPDDSSLAPYHSNYFGDFRVAIDAFWEGGSKDQGFGLMVCKHQSLEGKPEFIYFLINGKEVPTYVIGKMKNGKYEKLYSQYFLHGGLYGIEFNKIRLSVEKSGNLFAFYINDSIVKVLIIEDFTGGKIGVYSSDKVDASFDNFVITAEDENDWFPISGKLSMNLYGQLYIDEKKVGSSGILIGAFNPEGKCLGTADLIESNENWFYDLNIESNTNGEKITLKIWDKDADEIYWADNPVFFEAGQSILNDLNKPLNLKSISQTLGVIDKEMDVILTGNGFDEYTNVSMSLDVGNRRSIIGSLTPEYTNPSAITIVKDTAYMAGVEFNIIDISNPTMPYLIGDLFLSTLDPYLSVRFNDIKVIGDTVYAVCGSDYGDYYWNGMKIIDISNPSEPVVIGSIETAFPVECIAVIENTAYLGCGGKEDLWNGVQIMDVRDSENPVLIGSVDTSARVNDIAVVGDLVYAACGGFDDKEDQNGLQIIDVSSLSAPEVIGEHLGPTSDTYGAGITVIGNTVYLAASYGGFQIIDVSNPANPTVTGSTESMLSINRLTIIGNKAYVASDHNGLQILDLSNPSNPTVIGIFDTPGQAKDVVVIDDIAYVADFDGGLQVIDVSNPSIPGITARLDTPGDANDVVIKENLAYVADGKDKGLQILDISNPSEPAIIGSAEISGYATKIKVKTDTAYMIINIDEDERDILQLVDVSSSSSPALLGSVYMPGDARDIEIDNDIAYITDRTAGLVVIDISDSLNPKIITTLDTGLAGGITISNSTAYVACFGNEFDGLKIVDISNPSNPSIIGFFPMNSAYDVAVKDHIAYVIGTIPYAAGGRDKELHIVDISTPSAPVLLNSLETEMLNGIIVAGDMAYVMPFLGGDLDIFDISKPETPGRLGSVYFPGFYWAFAVQNNMAYIASRFSGMYIVSTPFSIKPINVNSNTSISTVITGPEIPGDYTLRVYNNYTHHDLNGACTFIPPEKEYILDTKAIIVAGGADDSSNKILEETIKAADHAYQALRYQGYTPESIYYLSFDVSQECVDNLATYDNLSYAINSWPLENPSATELIIYFVDHGKNSIFNINGFEDIKAKELDAWLDELQTSMPDLNRIIFIYDACQSGTFLSKMTPPKGKNRIIITSASAESAYFLDRGNLSFSFQFWDAVYNGKELDNAFFYARDQMAVYQLALIDANGNGIGNEEQDKILADKILIRRGYAPKTDRPYIYNISDEQILEADISAPLWASIGKGESDISRVWAVITPPDFDPGSPDTPVTDLPTIEMKDIDDDGTYEGVYQGFTEQGTYTISIHAMNKKGNYALPQITYVNRPEIEYIFSTSQEQILEDGSYAALWAEASTKDEDVSISRVWAEITPPYAADILPEVELLDSNGDGIYEGSYEGFIVRGTYLITIRAKDNLSVESIPMQTSITQTKGPFPIADDYESDDNPEQANIIIINDIMPQTHSFHAQADEDWIKFFAVTGETYTIRAGNLNAVCNPIVEVIDMDKQTILDVSDRDITSYDDLYLYWECPAEGVYYIKVSNTEPNIFGENITYDFEVNISIGPFPGFITGIVTEADTGSPIPGARIRTDANATALTSIKGTYTIIQESGIFSISVYAEGYESKKQNNIEILEGGTTSLNITMKTGIAKSIIKPELSIQSSSDDVGGTGCFISVLKNRK